MSFADHFQWIKGHATQEDVEAGRSTPEDKRGNDQSDTNADIGVSLVGGVGLVRLGEWLAARHDKYISFMQRIQKYIAVVTPAE